MLAHAKRKSPSIQGLFSRRNVPFAGADRVNVDI
jgi:hypothetical protein